MITSAVKIGPIGIKNLGWKFYIVFIVMTFLQLPIGESEGKPHQ